MSSSSMLYSVPIETTAPVKRICKNTRLFHWGADRHSVNRRVCDVGGIPEYYTAVLPGLGGAHQHQQVTQSRPVTPAQKQEVKIDKS